MAGRKQTALTDAPAYIVGASAAVAILPVGGAVGTFIAFAGFSYGATWLFRQDFFGQSKALQWVSAIIVAIAGATTTAILMM